MAVKWVVGWLVMPCMGGAMDCKNRTSSLTSRMLIEASKRQFIFCVVVYFGWCVSPVAVYYVID